VTRPAPGHGGADILVCPRTTFRTRCGFLFTIFSLIAFFTAPVASAQRNPPPDPVPYTLPSAAAPGSTADISFHLAPGPAAPGFWSTFPAKAEPLDSTQRNVVRFRLTIPPDAPVGIGCLRFMTTAGVSGPRLFLIDDIPTTGRAANNTSPNDAQRLDLPAAVEADADALACHYYRFAAKKGQRVAFETVAHRLGSRMDPVVRILDTAGHELAYVDDTPGLGADVRFAHTFAADGDYLVEIRDAEYQGGTERHYRLRIGDFPAVTAAFPTAVKRGAQTQLDFTSPAGERLHRQSVTVPKDATQLNVALKLPGGRTSTFVPVLCADADDFVATSPNDSIRSAARIPPLPAAISGRFTQPGQRHVYRLDATRGRPIGVRALTRGVNSPANVFLQLFNADGNKIAESRPTEGKNAEAKTLDGDDGSLTADIPADGPYYLAVTELTGAAGPAMVYRLEIEEKLPGFTLAVETDKVDASAGGTFKIKVKATRRNFDGPITLALTGDAANFELKNAQIPKGKTEIDLEARLPMTLPDHRPLLFGITGTAKRGDETITERVSTAPALRALWPRIAFPPPDLDGQIALGIKPTSTK
jgi:hypothetical protein